MDRGCCTIIDELTLVDCVNRSIADLHRYLGVLTGGDRPRAEQLVIDVYAAVARFARAGPCSVRFEHLRIAGRRRFVADARIGAGGPEMTGLAEATVVDGEGVVIALREVSADLSELAEVPDLERAVLVLHRHDGLTNDEIAAELGVSTRRVEVLLRRALRRVGLRSADAVQADVQHLAGTMLLPSPDLLHAVRRLVVAEWRGESADPVERRRASVPRRVWMGATAAVLAVFVGVAWTGTASVVRTERDERTEVPLSATASSVCPGDFSTQGLAERSFAFDGEVVETFSGTDITAGPVRAVTFDVHRWYRGGGRRRVTVRWRSDLEPGIGVRLLVSGDDSDDGGGVPVAMGCGYTLKWRDLDALLWRTVLLGTPSRDEVPSSALGRLWVVTSVHGQPWSNPVMPTFTLLSGGTITGQDGCGVYHVDENGNSEPSTPCDAVPEPVQVRRPFEFSSPELRHLTSEQVAAELFDLGEATVSRPARCSSSGSTPTVVRPPCRCVQGRWWSSRRAAPDCSAPIPWSTAECASTSTRPHATTVAQASLRGCARW